MSQPIITLREKKYAHLLANYLVRQGHPASVTPLSDGTYQISLDSETDLAQVKLICEAFIREPNHPRYQQAAWQTGEQINLPKSGGTIRNKLIDNARHAPFTAIIFILCTLTYGLSLLGLFPAIYQGLTMQPLGVLLNTHEWWRLIGPVFLHFSALHFVFNLLWWATLGAQIERTLGVSMLLLVFVVSAIASNIGQLLVSGPNFGGMSGVVYALLGFIWWVGWLKPSWGMTLPKAIVGFMLVWLVIGYADVLWVNMANTAHLVGLISGCLLAALLALGSGRRKSA